MEKLITRDGSITFHNKEADEHYHSKTVGALEEAEKKYQAPANIKPGFKILDVCFGLGYNTLAALAKTKELTIIALENDRKILDLIETTEVPRYKEEYKIIKKAAKELHYQNKNTKITIILKDLRESIKEINEEFDAVFFDPFSPSKVPELWTQEIFEDIKKLMKPGARLTTYSCARWIRENMKNAGLKVIDGPIFGRKSPSTIAYR